MEKVMKTLPSEKLKKTDDANKTARDLAILINNFLLEEMLDETDVPKRVRKLLKRATDCLKRVYKIGFLDYVLAEARYRPLPVIFSMGCRTIEVKDRLKAEQHKMWGNAKMADKSYKSAEIEYSRAIHLNPRNAVYWCNRAASRIGLESYFSAISDCGRALRLDRNYTKALVWQGIAHALTDHPWRAVRCYRRALRIEPGNEICIANMDVINRKINRSAFRVLDPLYMFGRQLASTVVNMAKNRQDLFKCVKSDGNPEEKYRKRQEYLRKFEREELD